MTAAQTTTDRRIWLTTDRPLELIASGSPLSSVSLMSVRDTDRCWVGSHEAFALCIVSPTSSTLARYKCRGEHEVSAGELMAFEPGDHHVTTRVTGKASFDIITIEPAALQRDARELGLTGAFHFRSAKLRELEVAQLARRVVELWSHGADRLALECAHAEFVGELIHRCTERAVTCRGSKGVPHARVRAVRDHLRDNLGAQPTLEELAELAGLSRFGFAHAFTRYVGMAPYAYWNLCRAAEARRRIERGAPIREVASALGYADVPALTRAIKAGWGVPPARWQRGFRANSSLAPRMA